MSASDLAADATASGKVRPPPWWTPRLAHGLTLRAWLRLLRRHRYDIDLPRWPRAAGIMLMSLLCSNGAFLQRLVHGRRIAAEPIPPPVFIIGHWRSGTTFLHELLASDERFLAPTTFECFCPEHFLSLSRVLTWFPFLMPKSRPMDDMAMGWNRPQEDEFALLAAGVGSPYEGFFFPNHRAEAQPYLHPEDLPDEERRAWEEALTAFLRAVAYRRRRQRRRRKSPEPTHFLLKSPTHTARIAQLAALFPGARFVHIARDPYRVFASSRLLWPAMSTRQLLHATETPDEPGAPALDAFVLGQMETLYRDFEADIAALPAGTYAELRYEALVRDPRTEIARLYAALGLSQPATNAAIDAHLERMAGYRPNRFALDEASRAMVRARWGWYFDRFGYARD